MTIITVVYNGSDVLQRTIDSVLRLRYQNVDYIIVDGGSTDGTVDVIKRNESRITHWISEPDRGIYDAMNKGWALARDDSFILFLGAGDEIISLPGTFEGCTGKDAICGRVHIGGGKSFLPRPDYRLKLFNTLHHQALLVNKSLHRDPPFNIAYGVYADFDFNQRLFKEGRSFAVCDTFESYAMPGGVSERYPLRESLSIVRKNFGRYWAFCSLSFYLYNTAKVALKRRLLSLLNCSRCCSAS